MTDPMTTTDHVLVGVMLADVAALVGTADVVLGSADLQVFSPWSSHCGWSWMQS